MTTDTPEPIGSLFVTHEGTCRPSYDKAALAREIVRLGGHLGKSNTFELYLARRQPESAVTVADAEVEAAGFELFGTAMYAKFIPHDRIRAALEAAARVRLGAQGALSHGVAPGSERPLDDRHRASLAREIRALRRRLHFDRHGRLYAALIGALLGLPAGFFGWPLLEPLLRLTQ